MIHHVPLIPMYILMHAGNASLMVRAGAFAYFLPLVSMYVILLFPQSLHFDFLLIEEPFNPTSDRQR